MEISAPKYKSSMLNTSHTEKIGDMQGDAIFVVVDRTEAANHHTYKPRLVDYIKDDVRNLSKLCIAAHYDEIHGLFTAAPTSR